MDSREKLAAFADWAIGQQAPAEFEGLANFIRPLVPALLALVLEDEPAVIDDWLLKAAVMATQLRSDGAPAIATYIHDGEAPQPDGSLAEVWNPVEL